MAQGDKPMTSVIIFSAGKGSRIGEDKRKHVGSKHTIKLDGETVIERQIRLITEECDYKIYIVAGENEPIIKDILSSKYNQLIDNGRIQFLKTDTDHTNALIELADVCEKVKGKENDIIVLLGDTVFSRNALKEILNYKTCNNIVCYVGGKGNAKGTWWNHDGEVFGIRLIGYIIGSGKNLFISMTKPYYELKNISERNLGDKVYIKECCDIDHEEDILHARKMVEGDYR
jgi:CTP:molybdopterin cytidylyltransferase MocA